MKKILGLILFCICLIGCGDYDAYALTERQTRNPSLALPKGSTALIDFYSEGEKIGQCFAMNEGGIQDYICKSLKTGKSFRFKKGKRYEINV